MSGSTWGNSSPVTVPLICNTCGESTGATITEAAMLLTFWRFYCSTVCRDSARVDAHRNERIHRAGIDALRGES